MTSILQKKNKKKKNLEKTTFKLNETKRKGQYKMGTNVYNPVRSCLCTARIKTYSPL